MGWKDTIQEEKSSWKDTIKPETESNSSSGEAALMHGIQGATGGFLDEASGVVEGAGRAVGLKGLGGSFSDIEASDDGPTLDWETLRDAYRERRDKKRKLLDEQSKDFPVASTVGNLGGMVVSPLNKLTSGMSLAKGGAVLGGINGLGSSEAEDVVGLARDTAMGSGLGAAGGKLIEKASPLIEKGIQKVASGAGDLAKKFAARAIGAERGTIKKFGNESVDDLGEYALKNNLLSPLSSADDILARNESVMSNAMNQRAGAYQTIDDAGASAFNPLEVATKVEDGVVGGLNRTYDDTKELIQALDPHLSNILSRGESNIPMKEAQELVESLGRKAKFDTSRNNISNDVAVEAYFAARKALNEAAEQGAESVGVKGLRDVIENANKTYSTGTKAKALLDNKFAREQGNKLIGLTDTIATAEAASSLGGPYGAALLAVKKGGERYGSQNAALGLDKISKVLMKSPQLAAIAESNPQVFQKIVNSLEERAGMFGGAQMPKAADSVQKNDDQKALLQKTQGTKYGQVLQNAAQKGDQSFNAAHFVLFNRDPEYRKQLEDENGGN